MNDAFKNYHPFTNFIYFLAVLLFAMFTLQPVCIIISFVAAVVYSVILKGMKKVAKGLCFSAGFALILIIVNPLFNHQGMRILYYLPSGNPLTYESIIYGVFTALLMITVIQWFVCYHEVMSSEKIICIFGKIMPSISLLLSMILRFIPRLKAQFKAVNEAQHGIHRGTLDGNYLGRIRNTCKIFSIVITWSMENSIETADSMKSRGYGLPGRSSFTMTRFESRDTIICTITMLLAIYVFFGRLRGGLTYRYFPSIKGDLWQPLTLSIYIAYALLNFIPVLIKVHQLYYLRYLDYSVGE